MSKEKMEIVWFMVVLALFGVYMSIVLYGAYSDIDKERARVDDLEQRCKIAIDWHIAKRDKSREALEECMFIMSDYLRVDTTNVLEVPDVEEAEDRSVDTEGSHGNEN